MSDITSWNRSKRQGKRHDYYLGHFWHGFFERKLTVTNIICIFRRHGQTYDPHGIHKLSLDTWWKTLTRPSSIWRDQLGHFPKRIYLKCVFQDRWSNFSTHESIIQDIHMYWKIYLYPQPLFANQKCRNQLPAVEGNLCLSMLLFQFSSVK